MNTEDLRNELLDYVGTAAFKFQQPADRTENK